MLGYTVAVNDYSFAWLWTYVGLEQYIIIHGRGCGKMLGYSVAVNDYSWAWLWTYVGLEQYIIIQRPYTERITVKIMRHSTQRRQNDNTVDVGIEQ